jgi:hypothetical protein
VRDQLGNELAPGDVVHVKVGSDWILGNIVKVQNGGIAVTGISQKPQPGQQVGVTPDALVLQIGVGFQGAPGTPQLGLFKVGAPNAVQNIIESSLKM